MSVRATPIRDLSDTELARLQALLDGLAISAPEAAPLDVSALDGYLCGVVLQPQPVPEARWWPFVVDAEARPPPPSAAAAQAEISPLVRQRHAWLADAIAGRRWFDPWIFEMDGADGDSADDGQGGPGDEDGERGEGDEGDEGEHAPDCPPALRDSVLPWVAGFALAAEKFPALMRHDGQALAEPLALLYQYLDADDLEGLEDEPALTAALLAAEPAQEMAEAAEDLVRAVLLLADISRPPGRKAPARASPGPGQRSKSARRAPVRRG